MNSFLSGIARLNFGARNYSLGWAIALAALASALALPSGALSQSAGSAEPGQAGGTRQEGKQPSTIATQQESPTANPGRPTVSTPATLTPVGYLQFESGVLAAWHSPGVSEEAGLNEVVKYSLSHRIELLAASGPYVHSDIQPANGTGGVSLGIQGVFWQGEGTRPTLAASYSRQVSGGDAPDLDVGSATNSVMVLASADVRGFHYDTNYLFNEVYGDAGVRRAQFGQTLSLSHGMGQRFGISAELWDFSQPFLRSHAVGNLWAVNCNAKKNLVFDAGFNRGLTSTSTRWELMAGFTYLLPHKLRAY